MSQYGCKVQTIIVCLFVCLFVGLVWLFIQDKMRVDLPNVNTFYNYIEIPLIEVFNIILKIHTKATEHKPVTNCNFFYPSFANYIITIREV